MDLDLKDFNSWLDQFINFERLPDKNMLKLATMQTLCAFFGHPESSYRCFHVAGSKGKGTISANIAAILNATGKTTGVYASPHVLHFTERIGTGQGPFPAEIYAAAEQELRTGINAMIKTHQVQKEILTWYELVTIFAMLCFRQAKVDYAVFEVGMGGRLDATNVIQPVCIAMGPIELEHTAFLGDTLEKIAAEKAGVFKDNVPVVSAPQTPSVQQVFAHFADQHHTTVLYAPTKNQPSSSSTDTSAGYQYIDASVAEQAVLQILPKIPSSAIKTALKTVHLPGRYECVEHPHSYPNLPFILYDVAHTENSIRAVLSRFATDSHLNNFSVASNIDSKHDMRPALLFGCAADKNVEAIAKLIVESDLFSAIYLTRPGDFKKSDFPRMLRAFQVADETKQIPLAHDPDFATFIPQVLKTENAKSRPLVVLGSFYLVGEVQEKVNPS